MSKSESSSEEYEIFEKSERSLREEKILAFWDDQAIFKKTLEKDAPKGEFVFYEGPPTANGRPGIHHVESRAFKDIIPRYKTMQGFHVRRKGGWDTHGLPVELQVEKELGLNSKRQVEEYGVAAFNQKCKESVWRYMGEWEAFSKRVGYWVDFKNPYITYENDYIESLWNVLKTVEEKKLLYKDYKVLPWCPRCGTALSSHELAQGYKDVKDWSLYVKFLVNKEYKINGQVKPLFILAWTTTPWTLPGNIALAINPTIEYVVVDWEDGFYFVAKNRIKEVFGGDPLFTEASIEQLTYEPVYPFLSELASQDENIKNAFSIYPASFVTDQDGTGIVHTAVMYGQDDFELGTQANLPKVHTVTETGHFVAGTDFLEGRFVKDEDVTVDIIKDLARRGLLFKKEKHEHSYPHCWRCSTPLIYFARDSWYIRMSELSDQMVKENESINWEPAHIRDGRFGEWLRGIKDWAISRERYWGTPLPIWESTDGERLVIGSYDELKSYSGKRLTKLVLMRHGESLKNTENRMDSSDDGYDLTDKGRQQAEEVAETLRGTGIECIYTSPVIRARHTAEIIAGVLGVPVVVREELREIMSGEWEGMTYTDMNMRPDRQTYQAMTVHDRHYTQRGVTGESWADFSTRTDKVFGEILTECAGANILIVGHHATLGHGIRYIEQRPVEDLDTIYANEKYRHHAHPASFYIDTQTGYIFDPHKPFIDGVVLEKEGKQFTRVREVMDVWFDSGAMPYAQDHYPFENRDWVDTVGTSADYIAEAVDQTRGWFYTLHAIATLLGRGKAFKNVVCLGHIMSADGTKMSKSKGNVVSPWEMIAKYGIDPVRLWMYSVNQPGDAKNFDEKTVEELVRKVFTMLDNIVHFYEMFKDDSADTSALNPAESTHVLDRWILAKTDELVSQTTNYLEKYKMLEPGRLIRDFVLDLSQWYIRRSRDRFKGDDEQDKAYALATTRYVVRQLALLMAPFTPFLAEELWQKIKNVSDVESVHLASWPVVQTKESEIQKEILEKMQRVRDIVSQALELRSAAKIKVRQPLARLTITESLDEQYLALIRDEVNVKEVGVGNTLELDTVLTPELEAEGDMRDVVRHIQEMRKTAELTPNDQITLCIKTDEAGQAFIQQWQELIQSATNTTRIIFGEDDKNGGEELVLEKYRFVISLEK